MPHTWGPKAGRQFTPPTPAAKQRVKLRVLFVCLGNSCRSQMAEGFALRYGTDVMDSASAGLAPAAMVAPLTRKAMLVTKGIDLQEHFPKSVFDVSGPFDLIVNMSGYPLPKAVTAREVRSWTVQDPVAGDESVHLEVANLIESMVQQLILEIRGK